MVAAHPQPTSNKVGYQTDKLEVGPDLHFIVSNRGRSRVLTDEQPLAALLSNGVRRVVSQTSPAFAQHITKQGRSHKAERAPGPPANVQRFLTASCLFVLTNTLSPIAALPPFNKLTIRNDIL